MRLQHFHLRCTLFVLEKQPAKKRAFVLLKASLLPANLPHFVNALTFLFFKPNNFRELQAIKCRTVTSMARPADDFRYCFLDNAVFRRTSNMLGELCEM